MNNKTEYIKFTNQAELISLSIIDELNITDFKEFKFAQLVIYKTYNKLTDLKYINPIDLNK